MNCKIGDLAIVIRAPGAPENIGRIVKVVGILGEVRGYFCWDVACDSPVAVFSSGVKSMKTHGGIPDAWLRPVSGLPITDDVEDEVKA
ncbi:hypothetical protein [Burkholderia multivorans]|uniref:hypothetical protein n=1 Tax=Burkholderia multivorans TaxID=87883 RepID=UPI001C23F8A4|nr:hypothetical protein [Burkholderia multivorans]MBU9604438.1 hypothetical protein [Burkholderia multivorans]